MPRHEQLPPQGVESAEPPVEQGSSHGAAVAVADGLRLGQVAQGRFGQAASVWAPTWRPTSTLVGRGVLTWPSDCDVRPAGPETTPASATAAPAGPTSPSSAPAAVGRARSISSSAARAGPNSGTPQGHRPP